MISHPAHIILPRELISYILDIKSRQHWKERRLPQLHKLISSAAVPDEIDASDVENGEGYYFFRYGNAQPISGEYGCKFISIEFDPGRESESDDEDSYSHRDGEIEITCTKGGTYVWQQHDNCDCNNCNNDRLWDDHYNGWSYEDNCSDWYPDEDGDRFSHSISFTIPFWRKQHGHWRLN